MDEREPPRPAKSVVDPLKPGDEAAPDAPAAGENVCRTCAGTGRQNGKPCPVCEGTGRVTEGIGGA